jgi:hypothetical protein
MLIVDVKGVGKAQFPDGMPIDDIRSFLQNKFSQRAINGQSDILQPVENIAAPYEPTLTEKIGSGISNALTDSGIISNQFGANQIGSTIAGIGEFLPGIGDATAGDEFGRAVAQGDKFGMAMAGLGIVPVAGDLAKKGIKKIKNYEGSYPLDDFDSWWGDRTYKEQGADMFEMSPDEYLSQVKPLKMDEETLENVDDLVDHMESGRKLDPLVIYADGKEDGRHRALAAKKLGMDTVPVIDYRAQQPESAIKPVTNSKTKDTLKSRYPDLKIGISENADNIILDKVIVTDKSQGTGTKFMNDLIDDADSKGKTIGLTPSADFGGNKKRLTEFYKRFGFIENKGKNKDFTINETMIRLNKAN